MPNKTLNAKLLWIQFEDVLAPGLNLTVWDRAVYSYLLRHSLVVGKTRLHFAVMSTARDLGLSNGPVRQAVRRLDGLGALRLLERSKSGHLVEMRRPEQIHALRPGKNGTSRAERELLASKLESTDFLSTWALRKAIHNRERGACFYCLRRTPAHVLCLDHVIPRAQFGRHSYRNLVSSCMECNTLKGDTPAPDFLRLLYRKGRLTAAFSPSKTSPPASSALCSRSVRLCHPACPEHSRREPSPAPLAGIGVRDLLFSCGYHSERSENFLIIARPCAMKSRLLL